MPFRHDFENISTGFHLYGSSYRIGGVLSHLKQAGCSNIASRRHLGALSVMVVPYSKHVNANKSSKALFSNQSYSIQCLWSCDITLYKMLN